jgi:beta-glucosidase
VVVLVSSFPYAINWTQQNVPSILHIAHAAQEQGTAIAEVLFGDCNPAGRLNQTWPKSLDQIPPMMDYDIRHGRTYMYLRGEPLYPFGYGLSYTTFKYSNLRYRSGTVSVDVTNTGKRSGDEVVQLYERAGDGKQLRAFARVSLKPNETRPIKMPFTAGKASTRIVVGSSSADERLDSTIGLSH